MVLTGKKVGANTSKYQKELNKLNKIKTPVKKSSTKSSKKTSLQHAIKKVYTKGNSIVLEYNRKVSDKDLKFFELHYKTLHKDIFDFKGSFKDAKPTKLKLNGVKRISIGQYKPNTLRIVLSHPKDLKTRYYVNQNKIIIKVLGLPAVKSEPKLLKKPVVSKKPPADPSYNIRSVYTKNNAIYINFNHKVTKKDVKFFELHYKNLHKDVFDIKGRFKDAAPTKLKINGVNKIVISQYRYKTLRISTQGRKNLRTIYILNNKQLIIKVMNLKTSSKSNQSSASFTSNLPVYNSSNKVVVIDAGHGGKDGGAVGPYKRNEKTVVLKVAKNLYSELRKMGYKVYITRSTDRFIKVKNRTVLANKKKADIFISVHANAAHKSKVKTARGIETYFLSPARSERAKRVAAKENKADIRKMNYSSQNALLTVLNQGKITASNKLAIDIQQNMLYKARKVYKDVVDGGVREGPFWVLVGAQMPSVLLEIGYISHPTESKRLYSPRYQKAIAQGIAKGVQAYFLKNP